VPRYDWTNNLDHYNTMRAHRNCTGPDYAPQHVPLIKTAWKNGTHPTLTPGANFVLGYNEPDKQAHGNLSPADAAAFWPEVCLLKLSLIQILN